MYTSHDDIKEEKKLKRVLELFISSKQNIEHFPSRQFTFQHFSSLVVDGIFCSYSVRHGLMKLYTFLSSLIEY